MRNDKALLKKRMDNRLYIGRYSEVKRKINNQIIYAIDKFNLNLNFIITGGVLEFPFHFYFY